MADAGFVRYVLHVQCPSVDTVQHNRKRHNQVNNTVQNFERNILTYRPGDGENRKTLAGKSRLIFGIFSSSRDIRTHFFVPDFTVLRQRGSNGRPWST